jgi:hypothetical protein
MSYRGPQWELPLHRIELRDRALFFEAMRAATEEEMRRRGLVRDLASFSTGSSK